MASTTSETAMVYDLLILVDATASMHSYLPSLRQSLPQIVATSRLTDCFSRMGIIAYRDYWSGGPKLIEWSGWFDQRSSDKNDDAADLITMAHSLRAETGSNHIDHPEALKTALAKAYEVMRQDATTIVILYADAPPHTAANGKSTSGAWLSEYAALSHTVSFGGWSPYFADWVSACRYFSGRVGKKRAKVFSFLPRKMAWEDVGYFYYLSTLTNGACVFLEDQTPFGISHATMAVLLSWMGAGKDDSPDVVYSAQIARYVSIEDLLHIENETDELAAPYFLTPGPEYDGVRENVTKTRLTSVILRKHLPKKRSPIHDLAKRYAADETYRAVVVKQLQKIIEQDVTAISVIPVFGTLWRAVCNDRALDARQILTSTFGLAVERIPDADSRTRMKAWLEESYDYTAEILDIVDSLPSSQRFPCVYLDPTVTFSMEDPASDEELNRPITSFRREELLEISRSCDYRILRRLGRVLTQLTYVSSREDLPRHISDTTDKEIPKIPIALATQEHGFKFWKILLHVIVPGTILSARPAALLAALSIRMGIEPLNGIAEQEMFGWRDKWNNLETPETWNVNCLSLLLDADQAYRNRDKEADCAAGLLKDDDRILFERLVDYKLLELNLDTTLTAQVGWTPQKSSLPIGPVTVCVDCQYPRSVTVMGPGGHCGHCLYEDYENPKDREISIRTRVSKTDDESCQATWVECTVLTCRSQYVVYKLEKLRVRPKCHYCRLHGSLPESERKIYAPWVECRTCRNRMIYPSEYRPRTFASSSFECVACTSGKATVIHVETTARQLSKENTTAWLIDQSNIRDLFGNRSIYNTISATGIKDFTRVQLFPAFAGPLHMKGKPIHNSQELIAELKWWVSRRHTQQGTCSLCFSSFRKSNLLPACHRSGCRQHVCDLCLRNWYGINGPGKIINTAALRCPFCRRAPRAQTLAKYSMGVHALANLQTAVQDYGQWYYAWCRSCSAAKRYLERVCAGGGAPEVRDWRCDECTVTALNKGGEVLGDMVKKCPGCGIDTQKVSGCGHIRCPVLDCGVHWCWFCAGSFEERDIYKHMSEVHGGFFGPEEVGDEEEEW